MDNEQRLALELKRARDLQAAFLPHQLPAMPGIETAVVCEPAFELTGDFFECVPLAMYEVGIFIADVRGKGIAAAIVQGMLRALFHAEAPKHDSPTPVLRTINRLMYRDLEPESFLTAMYGVLNLERQELRVVRAGHEPLILAHPEGGVTHVEPDGMGLGMDGGDVFDDVLQEQTVEVPPGSLLALYTDGLVDTTDAAGEPFGIDRLVPLLDQPHAPVETIAEEVAAAVEAHRGGADPMDDVTMLLVRITGT